MSFFKQLFCKHKFYFDGYQHKDFRDGTRVSYRIHQCVKCSKRKFTRVPYGAE